jgi:hypothetical protein
MNNKRFHKSIYFEGLEGYKYFLFQLVNFGTIKDELKFSFTYPKSGTGTVYSETHTFTDPTDIISQITEITYHNDGSFLQKFPSEFDKSKPIYKNPFGQGKRRTPLDKLTSWEGIIGYTVVDYNICRKPFVDNSVVVPFDALFFAGEPFECIICLGNSSNNSLLQDVGENIVTRIKDIGNNIDMILIFSKSNYKGQEIEIPGTDINIWSTNNVLKVFYNKSKPVL